MCGIAGIVARGGGRVEQAQAELLSRRLCHRGPDDLGYLGWQRGSLARTARSSDVVSGQTVCLVHRRLSILDLSAGGWQPMSSADGSFHIVFNGEIYNYVELRQELKQLGHQFRSSSDSEVLLAAYVQWGLEAFSRLTGMFALAVLDTSAEKLILARDHLGIKPLYYENQGQQFAFCSEIPPLLELPAVGREADPERLFRYLRYPMTDYGGDTFFKNIKQVPAGHYLELPLLREAAAGPRPAAYWRLAQDGPRRISFDQSAEKVRELFLQSVRLHLRSDVPVGCCLSGGIDSSAIVGAVRWAAGSELELHCFSHIAENPSISEEKWIDLVGARNHVTLHKIKPTAEDFASELGDLIQGQGEPFAGSSIFAQRCVFKLAGQAGIKVMLDGQGADELFAGYRSHVPARAVSLLASGRYFEAVKFLKQAGRLPSCRAVKFACEAVGSMVPAGLAGPMRRLAGRELLPSWMNAGWFLEAGVAEKDSRQGNTLRERLRRDLLQQSLPSLLRYEDRNSMAFSIESRVPFVTPSLVEFVSSLPEEMLISDDGTSKSVFRAAMKGIVPDEVLARRDKIGFAAPDGAWLKQLSPMVGKTLQQVSQRDVPPLNLRVVRQQWEAMKAGRLGFDMALWRWINVIQWSQHFGVRFD